MQYNTMQSRQHAYAFIWVCPSHARTLIIPVSVLDVIFQNDHICALPSTLADKISDLSHWIGIFTNDATFAKYSDRNNDELVDEFFNEMSQHALCHEEFNDDRAQMLGRIPPDCAIVQWYVRI